MRLETMIRRLAEKTNTPLLEQVLLGEKDVQELPMECMIWTGARLGSGKPRLKKYRDKDNIPTIGGVYTDAFYPIVRWQGKTISVSRLIFQILKKPDYPYRMGNLCNEPLCVNPLHSAAQVLEKEPEPEVEELPEETWTEEEVNELLDIYLLENTPAFWGEIIEHPLMMDVPHDLLREALKANNKEYLT